MQPRQDQRDIVQPSCSSSATDSLSPLGESPEDAATPTMTRVDEPQAAAQVAPEDVEDEPLLSSSEERFVMYPVRQVMS